MTMKSLAALIVLGLVTVHAVIALPETHDEELYDLYDPDIELNEGEDGEDVAVLRTNCIIGRPTQQSTTSDSLTSDRAVDGDYSKCSQTVLFKEHPWWRVELPSRICISKVTIRNSILNSRRLIGAVVRGGTSPTPGVNPQCGAPVTSDEAKTAGGVIERTCSTHPRGYISVEKQGAATLELCEVTVEGILCH